MTVNRYLMRMAWAMIVGCAFFKGTTAAQTPAAPELRKVFSNRAAITLPVKIDDRECKYVRELQFYVRSGPDAPWVCRESAPASQREFVFQAPQDGEYWFTVVTVDHKGVKNPADLTREAPGLVVVVDTQPPVCQVRTLRMPSGEMFFYCEVEDPHPDPSKTKMDYLTAAKNWQPLEPYQQQPGFYRVPDPSVFFGAVRVTAMDRAGNVAAREIKLATPAETAAHPLPAEKKAVANANSVSDVRANDAVPPSAPVKQVERAMTPPAPNTAIERTMTPVVHEVKSPAMVEPAPMPLPPSIRRQAEPIALASTQAKAPAKPAVQLINDRHVFLEYQLDRGGAGRVDVWITRDDCQTWQRLCGDADLRSPVEFELPQEGHYGIRLVVTDGSESRSPAQGETPDWCVEVDCSKPAAQLLTVTPSKEDANVYLLSWNAFDKNLKSDAIDLYCAMNPAGPWQPIVRGLRNDGCFRWVLAADGQRPQYVRMDVTDQAGNVTRCEQRVQTPADALPKAKVTGLMTATQLQSVRNQ